MYEHHDAVLHAMNQGLVIVDARGILVLANDEAERLLEIAPGSEGNPIGEVTDVVSLRNLLESGAVAHDEIHLTKNAGTCREPAANQQERTQSQHSDDVA